MLARKKMMTIAELANTVAQSFQKPIEVRIARSPDPNKPPDRYVPSTKRAQLELRLRQIINLRKAIERTVEFVKNSAHDGILDIM